MGFAGYQNSKIVRVPSASETKRFGHATDRITVGKRAVEEYGSVEALAKAVQREIDESNARILIMRYPANLVALVQHLRLGAADLYPGGSILYWEAPARPNPSEQDEPNGSSFEVSPDDRNRFSGSIARVLEDSFGGYINHYSANPLLLPGVVVEGYAEWAASTMAYPTTRVFVIQEGDEVVGAAIISAAGDTWEVELASVMSAAQGKGNYLALMRQVVDSAALSGIKRLVISTQSHNIAVQRAWAKLGFKPVLAIETIHLVKADTFTGL
jgi:GNAT superfamily N-acetyltransferase